MIVTDSAQIQGQGILEGIYSKDNLGDHISILPATCGKGAAAWTWSYSP